MYILSTSSSSGAKILFHHGCSTHHSSHQKNLLGCGVSTTFSSFRKFPSSLLCLLHRLQWISAPAWSLPWSTSFHSFFSDFSACRTVSHFFTHFPLSQFMCGVFRPYLKCVFHEVSPPWLMSSAVSCSGSIVAGWNHFCLAWGSPWLPLTRATLAALSTRTLTPIPSVFVCQTCWLISALFCL